MIFIHIVSFEILFAHFLRVQPLRFFAMSKSISPYFKPVGNHNGEQQVKLPDPTGPLTEELPSSVISAANKDALRNVSGCVLSHLLASVDTYTTLCFMSYILAR